MIDETAKRGGTKGSSTGPIQHLDRVKANTTDTYYQQFTFNGREEAVIGVVGDGKADIDCFVYDQGNHLITGDNDATATCALKWTPSWTGPFTLKIQNNGSRASDYLIVTN